MTLATLQQAHDSCRLAWFAAGCPMDRKTSPLRRRYVLLYNWYADAKRFGDTRRPFKTGAVR